MALNIHEVAYRNNNFLDLLRKFAGRGENESLASLEIGVQLLQT